MSQCMSLGRAVYHLTSLVSAEARGVAVYGCRTCSLTCRSMRCRHAICAMHQDMCAPCVAAHATGSMRADTGDRVASPYWPATSINTQPLPSVSNIPFHTKAKRDQFDGFRSVKVLKFDTPPESPKNCPEAIEDSVRLQISPSRPVSFFMIKPRFCPSRDQLSPVQSSRPLGFGKVFSDKPASYRHRTLYLLSLKIVSLQEANYLGHCFLKLPPASPIEERGTAILIEDRGTAIPIEDRDRVFPDRLSLCGVMVKRLPVSLVWRKNDFVGPN
ncbi:hypothetical protein DY000_02039520 [Brassica cretica]|uniref:SWIM-type domain-containing protein n=1 Tax=Brassica cretica TaxID=69181 RepID=A0ABQ7BFM0_BRACR|nr:hypothetical protein DY000_02039520 [Brassica cretica]